MSSPFFPDPTTDAITRIEEWRARSNMLGWLDFDARIEDGQLRYQLGFAEHHIGNEIIRALHGGVVSTFLQVCATAEIVGRAGPGIVARTVSVHCDFLRPAQAMNMQGETKVIQKGRRMAFLESIGWHEDREKPVGKANIAIRLLDGETR